MALGTTKLENVPTSSRQTSTTSNGGLSRQRSSATPSTIIDPTANTGFRQLANGKPRRLIALVSGNWKEGKTHFALGADPLIYYQSLDMGTEGVIEKFDLTTIRLAEYSLNVQPGEGTFQEVLDGAYPVWEKFKQDYYTALETDECKTIVWDTESEVWELIRLANFGELNPKTGRDRGNVWGPVNAEMLGLIRMAFGTKKSLIMLEKTKDEYINDKKTGRRERKGFGDAPFVAQVVMRAYRDGTEFRVQISESRDNPDLNGAIFPNDWNTIMEVTRGG